MHHRTPRFLHSLLWLGLLIIARPLWASGILLDPINLSIPEQVSHWRFTEAYTYPSPKLGISLTYKQDNMVLTLYAYDGGRKHVTTGHRSAEVRQQVAQAHGDVLALWEHGQVDRVEWIKTAKAETATDQCGPQFAHRQYHLVQGQARILDSHLYLTGSHNHFIKLRISYPLGTDQAEAEVEAFVTMLSKLLGGCSSV